jgi:hypothetical protein
MNYGAGWMIFTVRFSPWLHGYFNVVFDRYLDAVENYRMTLKERYE